MLRHSEDGGGVLGAVAAVVAVVPGTLDDSTAIAEDDCSSLGSTGTSVKKLPGQQFFKAIHF